VVRIAAHLVPLDAVNDLLPHLPFGPMTNLILRPLILPLALVCLVLGFLLWRFMGEAPGVLGMSLQLLIDAIRPEARATAAPAPTPAPVDPISAGLLAIQSRDHAFAQEPFLAHAQQVAAGVITAWIGRDLEPCRGVLSEACWQLQNAR